MPAGGVLRIVEAALERDPLGRRQLFEDFGLLFLRQILEDRHRVVGFNVAHALRDGLRRQFVEDFLAHRVVHFGERGEIEIDAEQFDQPRPLAGVKRFQHGAEIGFMKIADQVAQGRHVGSIDGAGDLPDEDNTDRTVLRAQRRCAGFLLAHADLGHRMLKRAACTPGPWEWANV